MGGKDLREKAETSRSTIPVGALLTFLPIPTGSVFYIVIPIVVVVLILKLCLIFWRVWLYSKVRYLTTAKTI